MPERSAFSATLKVFIKDFMIYTHPSGWGRIPTKQAVVSYDTTDFYD